MKTMSSIAPFALLLTVAACNESVDAPAAPEVAAPEPSPTGAKEKGPKETPPALPAARFLEVQGPVTIDGAPAAVDGAIGPEASIETKENGHAVITLGEGSVVEVRANTRMKLGTSERKKTSVSLLLGSLWSFLPKESSYEVVTPNAVAGVRGTVFYSHVENDKTSYICACDGNVSLTSADKKFDRAVPSKMGHIAFTFKSKGKRQKAKPTKRKGHTDAEKDALMKYMAQAAE